LKSSGEMVVVRTEERKRLLPVFYALRIRIQAADKWSTDMGLDLQTAT